MIFALIGAGLVIAGALLLYLASPNQLLRRHALPSRATGWSGLIVLACGLGAMLQWAGSGTAVFITFLLAMLVWTVVPGAAAWLRSRRAPQ